MSYQSITHIDAANYTRAADVPAVFGRKRTIDSFTFHWWGKPAVYNYAGAFDDVVSYLASKNARQSSAHYVVEAGKVACIVDPENAAWAAATTSGIANATSIHIELNPRASKGDYETVGILLGELIATYGNKPVYGHNHWGNTECPGHYDLAKIRALATVQPAPAAAPKPKPAVAKPKRKQTVTLPASAARWGIYRLGAVPRSSNIFHYLTPAAYGGLTYEIQGWTVPGQVALIDTGVKGRVQIYVAKGTGAIIR